MSHLEVNILQPLNLCCLTSCMSFCSLSFTTIEEKDKKHTQKMLLEKYDIPMLKNKINPSTSHPSTSKTTEPCPHLLWNPTALVQSPPACKHERYLVQGCAPPTLDAVQPRPTPQPNPKHLNILTVASPPHNSNILHRHRCKPQKLEKQQTT